ncbi:flagellar biosynthesis anti-sigma factor FlgM [Halalkalibacillus sediminis]|uniref:Negative regulator of flagellin synthesis n=1 Tax=Halalkalibacillus sediminis TaxID=2018042 RepID=A0A2I0QUF7_9BACI|nr:flagellar biosynthesis anti-sigma factor FlgM [Halalkalibacillus sediminis]PKR77981.1 flagellar biosynthesis anti-sigma factor FlgM [Halalkalibacillus sediminis]
MKINPLKNTTFNPYQKQIQKSEDIKTNVQQPDKLEISSQAKELQKGNEIEKARQEKVEDLKQQVQDGKYNVDSQKTAEKMVDFWSNRRM